MLPRPDLALHLTPEPETYVAACPPRFAGVMSRANRELTIAAEVHAEAFADGVELEAGIREIRDWGWGVVMADIADDEVALERAPTIQADIVQIDLRLPGRAESDEHHGVRRLIALAHEWGASVMALGVDSQAARNRAVTLGANAARGAMFGFPGPLPGA
jgi:EAL domain-containing protein (putative c-di-GMP-specific phosphodiesterase class I)